MKGQYDNRLFIQQCGNSVKSQKKCDFKLDLQRKKTCGGVYQRSAASAGQVRRSRVPRTYTEDAERTESAEDRACREITGIQSEKKAHGVFHQYAE
jgi:hypothetical protein